MCYSKGPFLCAYCEERLDLGAEPMSGVEKVANFENDIATERVLSLLFKHRGQNHDHGIILMEKECSTR